MSTQYFSDKERGPRARTLDEIPQPAWGGLLAIIHSRMADGSFAYAFPEECPDRGAICGCSYDFGLSVQAEIPELQWPIPLDAPDTLAICDLLEFCYRAVARAEVEDYHSYYRHSHYTFFPEEGKDEFRDGVNRVLARNGVALELGAHGLVLRLAPEAVREELIQAVFNTGDQESDQLLDSARAKFLSPAPEVRRDGIEKLWDAWERLKTIEDPSNKQRSAEQLLAKVSSETRWVEYLDREARELTAIGNNFRIRHSEIGKTPLENPTQVDYLFSRLFALIHLLLQASNRAK